MMCPTAIAETCSRIARGLTASACLSLLLSGCIASYTIRHEDPIEATPDAALVCRYNWWADVPYFRSENLISYRWAPASNFGHHDLAAALRDLTGVCPASDSDDRPNARVSAHALRHVNKYTRGAMALPMLFATGYTLGFLPIPLTDHFAVCLELTSPDGLRRSAIAQGRLDRFVNVWGSSNTTHHQGRDEQRRKVDEVMREVAVQAWRKAWARPQDGSQVILACREELDAIATGAAGNAGQ